MPTTCLFCTCLIDKSNIIIEILRASVFTIFSTCTFNQLSSFFCLITSITFRQDANAGKSLFLLYALKRSPRLTLFYLYLFDYSETFLPFLHTCCPAITPIESSVESSFLNLQVTPTIYCIIRVNQRSFRS